MPLPTKNRRHQGRHKFGKLPPYRINESLHGNFPLQGVSHLVVTTLGAWMAAKVNSGEVAVLWLAFAWLITLARAVDFVSYSRLSSSQRRRQAKSRYNRVAVGMVAVSICWAMYVPLFFGNMDLVQKTMVTMVLCAMAAGSTVVVGASSVLAITEVAALMLPVSLALLRSPGNESALGILGIFYVIVLLTATRQTYADLAKAVELSAKNKDLMLQAIRQQKKMVALNKKLSRAKHSLVAMNTQLEDKVRRRTEMLEREIDERESYRQKLERLAHTDPLTGLSNRSSLTSVLANGIRDASQINGRLAVFFIDLDRFKEINDGLGHPVGDKVLKTVASRLLNSGEHKPICAARWGGDEFVLVQRVRREDSDQSLEKYAQAIVDTLSQKMDIQANQLRIGASIGIAVFPDHGRDPDALIRHADMAVYEAKESGRGVARMFREEWQHRASNRHKLMQALKSAIADDSLSMVYQPIVDPTNGQVHALEALMRWEHPEFGAISPTEFIPLAEENGLMAELGNWGLRRACTDAPNLLANHCDRISVNVSVHQFTHGNFLSHLDDAMERNSLAPHHIELELTETIYARDQGKMLETLQAIRKRGVSIALDDFGTGYSSLAYLQRFPVDVLKVDRSFVHNIERGGDRIISTVTSLASSLNVRVVAEGVETVDQLRRVRQLGADHVQGFLFARPMDTLETRNWLEQHQVRTLVTRKHNQAANAARNPA